MPQSNGAPPAQTVPGGKGDPEGMPDRSRAGRGTSASRSPPPRRAKKGKGAATLEDEDTAFLLSNEEMDTMGESCKELLEQFKRKFEEEGEERRRKKAATRLEEDKLQMEAKEREAAKLAEEAAAAQR